ncbi:unnamed protein product [Prorocentrum cordatum]|uniref:Uncharacterized protein n=1 Tax=Prorocentrum cordatum TaxID=2364126 RepID=A0ABN9UUS6_9DINO|nr:unnamed protein product [Polarella glacialis]
MCLGSSRPRLTALAYFHYVPHRNLVASMPARVGALVLALCSAAEGLHLQKDAQPKLARADHELTAVGAEEAGWPFHRRSRQRAEETSTDSARVAVLVSGSVENLVLSPLLTNVVRANAQKGIQVDLFLSLTAPAKLGKQVVSRRQEANDPKIQTLLDSVDELSFNTTVMDFICDLAKAQLASGCQWYLEGEDRVALPSDATHRNIMTRDSPIETPTGRAVISRWRSLSRMWIAARAMEGQDQYSAVVVAREDGYWIAPHLIDVQGFQMDAQQVSTVPCLDSTGINDKAMIMGREAADTMLGMYQAWQKGDMRLDGTRTAEEALFRMATESGLNVKPEPMNIALSSQTSSGLPCFREDTFNLKQEEGYEQCFGESREYAPVTSLFSTFSCDTMNPDFYDMLWPQQVQRLHQTVAELASHSDRAPIVLTVVNHDEVEMAVNMLTSLQSVGEEAASLVVGTSTGICKAMKDSVGVAGSRCIAVQPAQDVRSSLFKHAVLTTVAAAGLTDRLIYAAPNALFARAPESWRPRDREDRQVLFARDLTRSRDAKEGCTDQADLAQMDSSVMLLSDAPQVTEILLRAWERMLYEEKASQTEALAAAVQATDAAGFGFLSCGSHTLQTAGASTAADKVLSWEMPPGVAENMRKQRSRANASAWVDWLRRQASGETQRRSAPQQVADAQRRAEYSKQASAWKETWERRVQELREENGYNETEVREQRKLQRQYNRAHREHHKKRVRYLPPDEAAKVKAKDEAWEASQEKQRQDDLAKAESRREAFQREVEKAQKMMDAEEDEEEDSTAEEDEAGAA